MWIRTAKPEESPYIGIVDFEIEIRGFSRRNVRVWWYPEDPASPSALESVQ